MEFLFLYLIPPASAILCQLVSCLCLRLCLRLLLQYCMSLHGSSYISIVSFSTHNYCMQKAMLPATEGYVQLHTLPVEAREDRMDGITVH